MKREPSEVQKHIEYASGYLDLKMYDEAVREADAALALEPDSSLAMAIKSAALWHSNRLQEAEPCVARLAEIKPKEPGIWINLAYIRRRTQSLDAAIETLRRAFEADPHDALAHFNMACYRAAQNRPEEAIALLRNAVRLDPKLKRLAREEPDFAGLRQLPEFQRVVGGK
jgi:tetratricopeptide (TPR) repeat protein